ncbi:zinc finger BED domain-containing protein [Tanacetum coccineum]
MLEHIFEYVDKCIEDVGAENVVQVVTDNASNNMGAAKLLHEKRPKIFWISCATHTINLMLEAIGRLSMYKKTLDQAKTLTVFIYAHHKTLALMRQFTKKRDIVRPGVTRFASGFLTLQSLAEKKSQLRNMFCSEEWEKCKFSKTVKGKTVYALVLNAAFWAGVTTCLKVFAPLVKVLRMVDADWKPSMGFIYGELKKARQDIKDALNDNENAYKPILDIIKKNVEARDSIVEFLGVLFPEDFELQDHINTVELPMYERKIEKFDRPIAIKSCSVNNEKFDPANWWKSYGGSAPNLRTIAIRILSLTTSSSGCERIWSIFEGEKMKGEALKNGLLEFDNALVEAVGDALGGRLRCKGVMKQIVDVSPQGLALRVVLVDHHSKDESGKGFKQEPALKFQDSNTSGSPDFVNSPPTSIDFSFHEDSQYATAMSENKDWITSRLVDTPYLHGFRYALDSLQLLVASFSNSISHHLLCQGYLRNISSICCSIDLDN